MASTTSTYDANDRLNIDAYDANGNTVSGSAPAPGAVVGAPPATLHSGYDFEDRVATATNANGSVITLTYDGDGNRVAKTVNGVTSLFLVDDRNPSEYAQVLEEYIVTSGQSPALSRVYTYGNDLISQDQLLLNGQGGSTWQASFYGYDGHGNVRYLTDTNAIVTDTYDYDAFGTLIAQYGATPNNYLYCGQQFDPDLGLYYNRARYLNTDSGRFWTEDYLEGKLRDPFSLHRYLYAKASPIDSIDPSGNVTVESELEAIGIDGENEKIQTPSGIRAYRKATKTVVCNMGRVTFTTALAVAGGHHIWPKFMGGRELQKLAVLTPEVHTILHKLIYLIAKNEPLLQDLSALGGPNGSAEAWEAAMSTPQGREAAFRVLRSATGIVDRWCGFVPPETLTNALETMLNSP